MLKLSDELNKFLDNENYKGLFTALSNPVFMAVLLVLIILLAVYLSGVNMIKLSFYVFLMTLLTFMLHDTILIKEIGREKIKSEIEAPTTLGSFEPRFQLQPHGFAGSANNNANNNANNIQGNNETYNRTFPTEKWGFRSSQPQPQYGSAQSNYNPPQQTYPPVTYQTPTEENVEYI